MSKMVVIPNSIRQYLYRHCLPFLPVILNSSIMTLEMCAHLSIPLSSTRIRSTRSSSALQTFRQGMVIIKISNVTPLNYSSITQSSPFKGCPLQNGFNRRRIGHSGFINILADMVSVNLYNQRTITMQYNLTQQPTSSNTAQPSNGIFKGSAPQGNSNRSGNIFSRNVIANPIANPSPTHNNPSPPSFASNPFNKPNNTTTNNIFANTSPTGGFLTTKNNSPLTTSVSNNPFNKPSVPMFNGGSAPQGGQIFNNGQKMSNVTPMFNNTPNTANTLGNGQQNMALFNNAKPTITSFQNTTIAPNSFTQPSQKTQNFFQPSQTSNTFNTTNPLKNPMQNNINQSTMNQQNPFNSPPKTSQQPINSVNSPIFPNQTSMASNKSPQQNTSPFSQASPSQIISPAQGDSFLQVQTMLNRINLQQIDKKKDPYSIYHSRLMMSNIFKRINSNQQQKQYLIHNGSLRTIKVKDYPLQQIFIMMKQMKDTAKNIQNIRENVQGINKKADQLAESLGKKIKQLKKVNLEQYREHRAVEKLHKGLFLIENELSYFIRPLIVGYEANKQVRFQDPNNFSLIIAKTVLEKVAAIESTISRIAAQIIQIFDEVNHFQHQNAAEAKRVILQLTECFETLCIRFELMKEQHEQGKTTQKDAPLIKGDRSENGGELTQKIAAVLRKATQKQSAIFNHNFTSNDNPSSNQLS